MRMFVRANVNRWLAALESRASPARTSKRQSLREPLRRGVSSSRAASFRLCWEGAERRDYSTDLIRRAVDLAVVSRTGANTDTPRGIDERRCVRVRTADDKLVILRSHSFRIVGIFECRNRHDGCSFLERHDECTTHFVSVSSVQNARH